LTDLNPKIVEESCQVFAAQGLARLDDIKSLGNLLQDEKYLVSLNIKLGAVIRIARGVLELGVAPLHTLNDEGKGDNKPPRIRGKKRPLDVSVEHSLLKKDLVAAPHSPSFGQASYGVVHTIAQCPKGSRGLANNPRRYCGSCKGCPGTVEGKVISKLTSHYCEQCKVSLHPQCFKIYHDWRDPKCKAGKHAPNSKIVEIMERQKLQQA
jgi:hypothetical protein